MQPKKWFKLYGSGDSCGLYIDDAVHGEESHLLGQDIREKIEKNGNVLEDWPDVHVFGSAKRFLRRRYDVVAPQFTAGCPGFTERAMALLKSHWSDIEWLPLKHRGGIYFFIAKPLLRFDVQDHGKSSISYLTGYPREPQNVTSLYRDWIHEFPELESLRSFCTPESVGRSHYVSEETKAFFYQNHITGAAFESIGVTPRSP
ncbi:MAG TPA: hypothetical protein DDW52_23085 [Planctomycetaceae bacterium]|nr:hypothetical protein [Planctomycetaceae bacterium]